jgi:pimeloyl-ACP methyl ester carboxylesterase
VNHVVRGPRRKPLRPAAWSSLERGILMSLMENNTHRIEVGGQLTRLLDVGSGRVAVVLHGWGGRIESMAPTIACLAAGLRVVAMDLPGFGEAPRPRGVWGTPDYAVFVRDVLAELSIDHALFVGHSFGAKTSLYLAATHATLVDKLVAVAASGLRSPPTISTRAKRVMSRGARLAGRTGGPGRRLRDSIYRRIASDDYREAGELRPILVRVVNEDLGPLLPRIQASTLLVWGDRDYAVPLSHGRRMEQLIPDGGLVVLEGAGHFAYLDQADRFCRIVRHFFGIPMS